MSNDTTPTPRTDGICDHDTCTVPAYFSRELERELTRVTAERDLARDGLHEDHQHNEALRAELAKVTAEREEAMRQAATFPWEVVGKNARLLEELAALRARVAELVADVNALQTNLAIARVELERASKHEACVANATGRVQWAHGYCGAALARAESDTPKGGGK